ncbi:MAG TPA: septation protein SepH, partial [Acidimicrobiales bacterium]|nr:septation protein SepH [Acidimicrobiales bacterium]
MVSSPGRGVAGGMRKLHVLGFSAEMGGFILGARRNARTGGYVLALDEELVRQFDEARHGDDVAGPERARTGVDSALTPREIQTRLRAGRSVEEVASEAR